MTSMLPPPGPPAGPGSLRERVSRGEPLLGVLARRRDELAAVGRADVDFVALPAGVEAPWGLPVLRLVTADHPDVALDGAGGILVDLATADAARAAVAAAGEGHVALVVAGSAFADDDCGADAVVQLVTDAEGARAVLARGGSAVYDLRAVLDAVAADLGRGRPEPEVSHDLESREPLVLLSGMLGDASLWDGVAERLGDIVLPCPARIDLDDSVPGMAETVLAAAPPRFALAGHSLGAIVALEIMRQAPHRVTRLALLNASARGPVDAQQRAWSTMRERTAGGGFAEVAAELARATLAPVRREDRDLLGANEAMARSVGPDGFLRQLSAQSTRPDSRATLDAIAVPVVVFSGEADEICPSALQQELVELCRGAELVTLPGGHMLPLEDPAGVAGELRARLAPAARDRDQEQVPVAPATGCRS